MLKRVSIQVSGSDEPVRQAMVVTPETTAQELLARADLSNYELCPSADQLPFGPREPLFDRVAENSVLFAYRQATAGLLV